MSAFATINDVLVLKALKSDQIDQATALLDVVSDRLRFEAKKVGKDLDTMVEDDDVYANVVKSVVAGIVERTVKLQESNMPIASQYSQSALGYSISGTIQNPGESLYIKNNELKALGLKRQRYGALEVY